MIGRKKKIRYLLIVNANAKWFISFYKAQILQFLYKTQRLSFLAIRSVIFDFRTKLLTLTIKKKQFLFFRHQASLKQEALVSRYLIRSAGASFNIICANPFEAY